MLLGGAQSFCVCGGGYSISFTLCFSDGDSRKKNREWKINNRGSYDIRGDTYQDLTDIHTFHSSYHV